MTKFGESTRNYCEKVIEMAKGIFLVSYDDLLSDIDYELQNQQIRSLLTYDLVERKLKTPSSLLYYREPTADDYPIDLNKGLQDMIKRESDPEHYLKQKTLQYIMMQKLKPQFDICTTRGALSKINFNQEADLVAIKYKDCIYINSLQEESHAKGYQFLLRQNLYVDAPGDLPNTDEPVNLCNQIYANFSAQLGKFNLLYSAEITGVDNTEKLDDLDDIEVLKQLRISIVKLLYYKPSKNWNTLHSVSNWLFQAHFADIKLLRLAICDGQKIVQEPIQTSKVSDLFKIHKNKLQSRLKLLHNFLDKISQLMAIDDCPYSAYVFCIRKNCVHYEHHIGKNKYSFLEEEYISFINDQYKS